MSEICILYQHYSILGRWAIVTTQTNVWTCSQQNNFCHSKKGLTVMTWDKFYGLYSWLCRMHPLWPREFIWPHHASVLRSVEWLWNEIRLGFQSKIGEDKTVTISFHLTQCKVFLGIQSSLSNMQVRVQFNCTGNLCHVFGLQPMHSLPHLKF